MRVMAWMRALARCCLCLCRDVRARGPGPRVRARAGEREASALGLKSASDLCLEAWTTRVASGPGAVGVPRPPRAGRGRGYRRYSNSVW